MLFLGKRPGCKAVPSGYPIPDPNPKFFPIPVFRVSGISEIKAFSLIPPWSHFWWLEHRPIFLCISNLFNWKGQSKKHLSMSSTLAPPCLAADICCTWLQQGFRPFKRKEKVRLKRPNKYAERNKYHNNIPTFTFHFPKTNSDPLSRWPVSLWYRNNDMSPKTTGVEVGVGTDKGVRR